MDKRLYALSILTCFSGIALGQSIPTFEDVDTNGDGAIDPAEAAAVAALDFESADTNQDGMLSLEEYTVAAKVPKAPFLLIVE
jgi:EF hand